MALCPGDTTEWDDIQRKFGNLPPLEKEVLQRELDERFVESAERFDPLENRTLEELNAAEDDVSEEDFLQQYRRQRLAELKAARASARFGELRQLCRASYVQEVTEASAGGQWVLLLLYTDANYQCHPMMKPWAEAATRFPMIKFLQGIASEIIPDFPDSLTPTVIIYKDKECVKQVQGLDDWGGGRTSIDTIEWHLAELGIIETDQENDPRTRARVRSSQEDEEFQGKDSADDRAYTSSRLDRVLRGKWT